jgi:membrane fusion protein (multidrug efflux system)
MRSWIAAGLLALALVLGAFGASADAPAPQVGVVRVAKKPVRETSEFVGRIEATDRVNLVARVTAFLEEIDFKEGAEVHKGDLLYRLEQPPFEADVAAKAAQVAQYQAQLQNAAITRKRAELLLHTPAGQQSTLDDARANELALQAELMQAEANLRISKINLGYTEIRAPIDGKIGRTNVTVGNVVSPSSGTLATIVSQDPMYVLFPVALREVLDLRKRYADQGGLEAVILRLRLPDGRIYGETGHLDFVDNTVSQNTDTLLLRGVIPNPPLEARKGTAKGDKMVARELTDGEFVTVILEGVQPIEALTVPRAAVLTDMAGDYVYVVGAGNRIEQRRIVLGQTSPAEAVVLKGLSEGELVVLEGLQKVRPGLVVMPGPATPPPAPDKAAAAETLKAE